MREKFHKIKLGLFVVLGTLIFSVSLYFIGDKQSLFERTVEVNAVFTNVNGLQKGNNVRFSGINVGTVKDIIILNDTAVLVKIGLKKDVIKYIKKDAMVSIGTDGLMGNKLINISSGSPQSPLVRENDTLPTVPNLNTDEVIKKLELTNDNVFEISQSLMEILSEVQNGNGLVGNLISDSLLANNIGLTFENLRESSVRTASILGKIEKQVNYIHLGKGSMGELLFDTAFSKDIKSIMAELLDASENTRKITEDAQSLLVNIKKGRGGAGLVLSDPAFSNSLEESMESVRLGTESFNRSMEALEHSIFLRGYLKRKDKKESKELKKDSAKIE